MNRRHFLARLGFGTVSAAAAISTFDIERLLWVPGEKTIVLPAVTRLVDRQTGISIRFIQKWDISSAKHVNKLDVFLASGPMNDQPTAVTVSA